MIFNNGNGTKNHLLNQYYLQLAKPLTSAVVPSEMKSATSEAEPEEMYVADTGYVQPTAEQLAELPELPMTEEMLANTPSAMDMRNQGYDCQAFTRLDQGSCGSCWSWAASATFSAKVCYVTKGAVNIQTAEESFLDCFKSTSFWTGFGDSPKSGLSVYRPAKENTKPGCSGASFLCAFNALKKKGGFVTRKCNPYSEGAHKQVTINECGNPPKSCRRCEAQ